MPKMKTNRSAAKRLKRTGSGKLKRNQSMHGHLLTKKSAGRKRRLRRSKLVDKRNEHQLNVLIPY